MASRKPRTGKNAKDDETGPPPRNLHTLDDAVAVLLQLEPSDTGGFAHLKTMLASIASSGTLSREVSGPVNAAVEVINRLLNEGADGEEALIEVSRLLEDASTERESIERTEQRQEPTKKTVAETMREEAAQPAEAGQSPDRPPVAAGASPESQGDNSRVDCLPPDADRELLDEFINESQEMIESSEAALLALETNPEDLEAVNSVFRAFHTIKGTSGFLGLACVTKLAHRAESLLTRVRAREIQCTGIYADLTLRSIDILKELMQSVRGALSGRPMERPRGYEELLEDLADPRAASVRSPADSVPRLGDLIVAQGLATRKTVEEIESRKGTLPLGMVLVQSKVAKVKEVASALRAQRQISSVESSQESSLRVRTDRLDRLIDMVGELVIAQSMVAQDRTLKQDNLYELIKKVTHLGKIVRELQDLSMSMRMVPLRATFQKMHRLVRDLAHKSGKSINLAADDRDTEIDRHMVDIINDLMVHMVRNAVDHGIEPGEVRAQNGKDKTGNVRLTAFHSGGNVVVEIHDDGRGLNREKIVQKALATGLIASDKGMSDSEVYNLIFAPGFSTADQITDVSGRGVGMDVVRKGVETLRGRIEIASVPGQGTTFSVRLPLTLAITDGMLVKVGSERYIVPTINIHLCFRPKPEQLSTVAGRGEMVLLRGELMPVFRLHRLFASEGAIEDLTAGLLVVVGDGEHRCTLLVDELLGQQQFVAKSLGEGVGKVPGVSGGAILGDGQVGLILDAAEIAALGRQSPSGREGARRSCITAA